MDSTRPEPLTYSPEPHVTIGDMIAFVLRTWKPVFAGCLVVGTIALLMMLFVLPDIYEASPVLVGCPADFQLGSQALHADGSGIPAAAGVRRGGS